MKLAINHAVETQGLGEESTFHIAANAKAFQALSSTLYTKKVRAVLREVGCNAQDSHTAAGIRRPIVVKVPNAINQEFYIQDFGVGLDHDQVKGLYTTYFSSTKDQSNDQVGAFGLGSKSPFAYTDAFTVEAVKDGSHRTYAAFMGPNGEPKIALVQERPADPDWTSGVKIGFAVAPTDIAKFTKDALDVFKWFDPLPQLLGIEQQPKRPDLLYDNGKVGLAGQGMASELCVVMGGVEYPVPNDLLEDCGLAAQRKSSRYGQTLYIFAPIGSVEVAISREALSFTNASKAALTDLIQNRIQSVHDELQAVSQSFPSLLEQYQFWARSNNEVLTVLQFLDQKVDADLSLAIKGRLRYQMFPGLDQHAYAKTSTSNAAGYRITRHGGMVDLILWQAPSGCLAAQMEAEKPGSSTEVTKGFLVYQDVGETVERVRSRLRTLFDPESVRMGTFVVILTKAKTTEAEPDLASMERRLGVPIIRLSTIVPYKKDGPKGEEDNTFKVSAREITFNGTQPELGTRSSLANFAAATAVMGNLASHQITEETRKVFIRASAKRLVEVLAGWDELGFAFVRLNWVLVFRYGLAPLKSLLVVNNDRDARKLAAAGFTDLMALFETMPVTTADQLGLLRRHMTNPYLNDRYLGDLMFMVWVLFPEYRERLRQTQLGREFDTLEALSEDWTTIVSAWTQHTIVQEWEHCLGTTPIAPPKKPRLPDILEAFSRRCPMSGYVLTDGDLHQPLEDPFNRGTPNPARFYGKYSVMDCIEQTLSVLEKVDAAQPT